MSLLFSKVVLPNNSMENYRKVYMYFFLKNYCSKLLSAFLLKDTVVVSLSFLTLATKAFKKGVTHIGTNSLLIEQIPSLE